MRVFILCNSTKIIAISYYSSYSVLSSLLHRLHVENYLNSHSYTLKTVRLNPKELNRLSVNHFVFVDKTDNPVISFAPEVSEFILTHFNPIQKLYLKTL